MSEIFINGLIKVKCTLPSGAYCLGMYSSTGKTYLVKTLEQYKMAGKDVNTYTYADYINGVKLPDSGRLVIFDRLDMYPNVVNDAVVKLVNSGAVVLLDCKQALNLSIPVDEATIKMKDLFDIEVS